MSATLTIRKLDDEVKRKLRLRAATHQRSMEAEVRDILTSAVAEPEDLIPTGGSDDKGKFSRLLGIWKERGNTDEVMTVLRGDEKD